jgi:hypothetical protein
MIFNPDCHAVDKHNLIAIMSYDLFFKPRQGAITEEAFGLYFRDRPHYQYDGAQASYGNEDTGVYFVFELELENEPDEDEGEHFPVALNINYLRPSYFILEAEPEVAAFVKNFDLLVSDPQSEGMGDGEYNAEKLLSGWNHGNEFAYSAILKDEHNRSEFSFLPTEQLHSAWRWNYSRSSRQEREGELTFVPRIMFLNLDGTTVTGSVWPDGIAVAVARVDYLCVPRKELAPTNFFRKKEDTTFVTWADALPILRRHGTQDGDGSLTLNYTTPPADVVKFVQALPTESRAISGLAPDRVLDRDIFERSVG